MPKLIHRLVLLATSMTPLHEPPSAVPKGARKGKEPINTVAAAPLAIDKDATLSSTVS